LLFRIYSGISSKLHLEALKNGISESTIRTRVEMVLLVIAMNIRSILLKAARQAIALVGAVTIKVRAKIGRVKELDLVNIRQNFCLLDLGLVVKSKI
jgi:hypothetical protein